MNPNIAGLLELLRREMSRLGVTPWTTKELLNRVAGYFYKNNLSISHAHELPYGRSPASYETARMYELMQEEAFRKANPPAFVAHDFAFKKEDTMLPYDKKEMKPTNRAIELLQTEKEVLATSLKAQRQDQSNHQNLADAYKKSADKTEAKLKQVTAAIKKIS